jgi:hypothetical protein
MFIWTFLLRITHTIISQSIADSFWITLYVCMWVYVCIVYVCTCVCMCVSVNVCMYVCASVWKSNSEWRIVNLPWLKHENTASMAKWQVARKKQNAPIERSFFKTETPRVVRWEWIEKSVVWNWQITKSIRQFLWNISLVHILPCENCRMPVKLQISLNVLDWNC